MLKITCTVTGDADWSAVLTKRRLPPPVAVHGIVVTPFSGIPSKSSTVPSVRSNVDTSSQSCGPPALMNSVGVSDWILRVVPVPARSGTKIATDFAESGTTKDIEFTVSPGAGRRTRWMTDGQLKRTRLPILKVHVRRVRRRHHCVAPGGGGRGPTHRGREGQPVREEHVTALPGIAAHLILRGRGAKRRARTHGVEHLDVRRGRGPGRRRHGEGIQLYGCRRDIHLCRERRPRELECVGEDLESAGRLLERVADVLHAVALVRLGALPLIDRSDVRHQRSPIETCPP